VSKFQLRPPQLGALHAVLAHWTTRSSVPATVVVPTGTAKTETMLALLASAGPERLLVVVPSDALRAQTAAKFETFGVLQDFGVVAAGALRPVVGQVHHRFETAEAARGFAALCNVVIATPAALDAAPAEVRQALLDACSHPFVDEAHHIAATTWRSIRDAFGGRPVVQFTANCSGIASTLTAHKPPDRGQATDLAALAERDQTAAANA
jgi:superfamily II DNA or RNA helicase